MGGTEEEQTRSQVRDVPSDHAPRVVNISNSRHGNKRMRTRELGECGQYPVTTTTITVAIANQSVSLILLQAAT